MFIGPPYSGHEVLKMTRGILWASENPKKKPEEASSAGFFSNPWLLFIPERRAENHRR